MKSEVSVKHWLHVLLLLVTLGFYAPVYLLIAANASRTNEQVRAYNDGFNAGMREHAYRNQ